MSAGWQEEVSNRYRRGKRRRGFNSVRSNLKWGAALLVVGVVILGLFGSCTAYYTHESSYKNCLVIDKDRTSTEKGGSDMRVYTDNCGTLSVGDNWFKGITNSADIFARIKPGHRYDFKATGWRFSLTSTFPVIISSEEVTK